MSKKKINSLIKQLTLIFIIALSSILADDEALSHSRNLDQY
jgi:hypothetical protein